MYIFVRLMVYFFTLNKQTNIYLIKMGLIFNLTYSK